MGCKGKKLNVQRGATSEPLSGERNIALTQGFEARVSACDYDRVSQHKWHVLRYRNGERQRWNIYAGRSDDGKTIRLHRYILEIKNTDCVDHIDGDGLNCVRSNMRVVSRQQNRFNSSKPQVNGLGGKCSSRFKGVTRECGSNRWSSYFVCDKKRYYLGIYDDEIVAALAVDEKSVELAGGYARTNFAGVLTLEEMRVKINSIRDRMFSVEVVKKSDGNIRTMNCRMGVRKHGHKGIGPRYSRKEKGLCCVHDVAKDAFRTINVSGVRILTVNKQRYTLCRWSDENPRRRRGGKKHAKDQS